MQHSIKKVYWRGKKGPCQWSRIPSSTSLQPVILVTYNNKPIMIIFDISYSLRENKRANTIYFE